MICPTAKAEYFYARGWTVNRRSNLTPRNSTAYWIKFIVNHSQPLSIERSPGSVRFAVITTESENWVTRVPFAGIVPHVV